MPLSEAEAPRWLGSTGGKRTRREMGGGSRRRMRRQRTAGDQGVTRCRGYPTNSTLPVILTSPRLAQVPPRRESKTWWYSRRTWYDSTGKAG